MNRYYITSFLPALIWASFIFYLSSIPDLGNNFIKIPSFDKICHFTEYTILGMLVTRAFVKAGHEVSLKILFISVLLCIIYGVLDEIHQRFVPNRQFDIFDMFWDGIGASVAQLIWMNKIREVMREKKKKTKV